MAYSDKVIDHYENPRNVGTLDKNDEHVGTGLVGAPAALLGRTPEGYGREQDNGAREGARDHRISSSR